MAKLTDFVYCLAYQNHRYAVDEYMIEFYTDWNEYARALSAKKEFEDCKIIEFSFRPIDLMGKEEHDG